ncbi:MAG: adenylate/guanylate cyclase domain-containing protein [Treponema sp.]|nr:adenylate/guanylate cyclase domain-containing protein [Treponema sp.]
MKIKIGFLFIFPLICIFAFTSCDSDTNRLYLDNFQIFTGTVADREKLLKSNFELDVFKPYNRESLVNVQTGFTTGGNYHVFKTYFTIPEYFRDKNLSLYIDIFDMPVVISVNDIFVCKRGLRPEIEGAYSTGETAVTHVPLEFAQKNKIVVEVFPQFETNSLPEISIAEYKDNEAKVFLKNLLNKYLVIAAQFLAVLVAFYHFGSFISRGCKDPKYIIFAFFSLSFALAYSNIGFAFDSKNYTVLVKLTRSFQLLSLGFYLMYIIESTGLFIKQKKYIFTGLIIYSIICAGYPFIQNDKYSINAAFNVMTNFYFIPILLSSLIIPIISIIVKRNLAVILLLATTLTVIAATLRDMLLLTAAAFPLFWLSPYAFFLIIIVIYGILVHEESSLFKNFKRYVPADLVVQLINQNIKPDLGGKQQELTVFFSDISKFTSIVEKMEPEKLIMDLCIYFESISKNILAHKGTIDKYIGDSVMAFWGAPLPMEDHAQKACLTALKIQSNLRNLFSQWDNLGKVPFLTRIGIHTGSVLVGNLGYKERLNYTVVGDTVNVSSRLEGINKVYGTEIIVSENVFNKCQTDFEFRMLDRVSLLGRCEGMNIYELITFKEEIIKKEKKINEFYEIGLKYYFEQNWNEALKYFNTVIKYRANDLPGKLMRERCLLYRKNPPPADWNGVYVQTNK